MGADHHRIPRPPALAASLALAAVALACAQAAVAAPTVTLKASASAIPKNLLKPKAADWPHTGTAGEGAELTASFQIHGTEDAGLPAPLRRVVISLPNGAKVHTSGFGSCRPTGDWYHTGDAPICPGRSLAGAATEALDLADFAGSDVAEPIRQGVYFTPGGHIGFWVLGLGQWLNLQDTTTGSLTHTASGYQLAENLSAIEAPGADLQPQAITVAIGAAYQQDHSLASLITLPKSCPAGGYPVKATLSFGEGPEAEWANVNVAGRERCGP
jgi:hypothetical protein